MAEDENVHSITVKSNSVISKSVTRCLNALTSSKSTQSANAKKPVVEIIADAKAAGKAITIVEIVKRRITEHGGELNQTTRVQEKPPPDEEPVKSDQQTNTHLQGEGYQKARKKVIAQIVIRLESMNTASQNVA